MTGAERNPRPEASGGSPGGARVTPADAAPPPTAWSIDLRTWGPEFALATGVLVVLAALGVLWGVLWQAVTPGAEIVMSNDGPVHSDVASENYFADDGWFAVIGGVSGVLSALASWLLVRRHRGPVIMIGTVAGCLVGAVVAWQVGRHVGLAEFQRLLDHADPGETFRRPARLWARGVLGVQGFTAAFTYTLLAGWSRWPTLRPPSPEEWVSWRAGWSRGATPYPAAVQPAGGRGGESSPPVAPGSGPSEPSAGTA